MVMKSLAHISSHNQHKMTAATICSKCSRSKIEKCFNCPDECGVRQTSHKSCPHCNFLYNKCLFDHFHAELPNTKCRILPELCPEGHNGDRCPCGGLKVKNVCPRGHDEACTKCTRCHFYLVNGQCPNGGETCEPFRAKF